MPLAVLAELARLVGEGSGNETARLELLRAHRERIGEQMARLTDCLALIDTKVTAYERHLANGSSGDPWQPSPSGGSRGRGTSAPKESATGAEPEIDRRAQDEGGSGEGRILFMMCSISVETTHWSITFEGRGEGAQLPVGEVLHGSGAGAERQPDELTRRMIRLRRYGTSDAPAGSLEGS